MFVCFPFQEDNTIGIANGQGPQQDHINEAENRGVRSDAQRQSQNGNSRETGRFAPHAEAKAQILNEALNSVHASRVAAFLFGLLDTIQVESRDRKSTRLNSSHRTISYAVFCLKKKKHKL